MSNEEDTVNKLMSRYYRRDGTNYPKGDEGLLEWAKDFEDISKKRVEVTYLENGIKVSTIWLGLDHRMIGVEGGKPLIFETMVFHPKEKTHEPLFGMPKFKYHEELYVERYSTEEEAREGHERAIEKFLHWKEDNE